MKVLTSDDVLLIHEDVITKDELQGLAGDKSLDAVIARVDNRIHFGMIRDEYDLAATYAVVIAVGHLFNDANKRTAFTAMETCLRINGHIFEFKVKDVSQMIVKVAQGQVDEAELARYLRSL